MGGDMKYLIIGAAFVLALCVCQGSAAECATYTTNTACCGAVDCLFCAPVTEAGESICQSRDIPCATSNQCEAGPTSAEPETNTTTTTTTTTAASNTTSAADTTEPTPTTAPESTSLTPTTGAEVVTNGTLTTAAPNTTESSNTTQADETTVTESPTTLPSTPAACDPSLQHFDAPSFIGGIVLCGAVIAIAFFGCKFYKKRSDTKYQQF